MQDRKNIVDTSVIVEHADSLANYHINWNFLTLKAITKRKSEVLLICIIHKNFSQDSGLSVSPVCMTSMHIIIIFSFMVGECTSNSF